nr:MAG TPA: hypothetical protein [Caudoviricetes sp.]
MKAQIAIYCKFIQGETMNTKEVIEIAIEALGVIVKHIGNNGDGK